MTYTDCECCGDKHPDSLTLLLVYVCPDCRRRLLRRGGCPVIKERSKGPSSTELTPADRRWLKEVHIAGE